MVEDINKYHGDAEFINMVSSRKGKNRVREEVFKYWRIGEDFSKEMAVKLRPERYVCIGQTASGRREGSMC